jgi:putative transposase
VRWLFRAKKKYGLVILNYAVTSNHIHLLVYDDGREEVIPRSIQLVASRTAREYNLRKRRSGAFWEDHYHATAVETGSHLIRCLVYIDLNMVRAGVVDHPREWPFCGYTETMSSRQRYLLINRPKLMDILNIEREEVLKSAYEEWIKEALNVKMAGRESKWTESVAVGEKDFVERIKNKLGARAGSRKAETEDGDFVLREKGAYYRGIFAREKGTLSNPIRLKKI